MYVHRYYMKVEGVHTLWWFIALFKTVFNFKYILLLLSLLHLIPDPLPLPIHPHLSSFSTNKQKSNITKSS